MFWETTTTINSLSVHVSHQRAKLWQWRIIFLVLAQAVKGAFVLISLSIQKGKSICAQDEGAKEIHIHCAPPRNCAQCFKYITSFHAPSKVLSEFAVSISSPHGLWTVFFLPQFTEIVPAKISNVRP